MNYYNKRQIEIVEFAEQVYHSGLRHKGINGSLYEDKLISYLREDIVNYTFFKGQIISGEGKERDISTQIDIIICKKGTKQLDFLKSTSQIINAVNLKDCLGVIEVKKWGFPKMISVNGNIEKSYNNFKNKYPELSYFFVSLRFKDRKTKKGYNWTELSKSLNTDASFCFYGRVDDAEKEWEFPWEAHNIDKHSEYFGQYENLIHKIKELKNEN